MNSNVVKPETQNLLKAQANLSDGTVKSHYCRRPKSTLEIRKKATFIKMNNKTTIHKFFEGFTKDKKKTNRVEVFSHKLLPSILKHRDVLFNNVEKILSNSYRKDQLIRMEV